MSRAKKILFISLGVIGLGVGIVAARFALIQYWPHDRLTIILPFAAADDELIFINPMGERVQHVDAPRGHPGLDLGWHHPAPLIAAAAGKVTSIKEHPPGGHGETEKVYNVTVVSGVYAVRYEEISPIPSLKVGQRIRQGEVIGRGGRYEQPGGLGIYYNTHWEFDFNTPVYDRLCPMSYFTPESKARIEEIWAKVGTTYDGRYPEVCSGDYQGRQE